MELEEFSTSVALKATPKLGFDPFSILMIFLPLVTQCIQSQLKGMTEQEYLRANYNAESDSFNRTLMVQSRGQARKANRIAFREGKSTQRLLTHGEADHLSYLAYKEAMESPVSAFNTCRGTALSTSIPA